MLDSFDKQRLAQLAADEISDSLEQGSIVFFPESPVALPSADDLEFIRQELPALLKLKNISYHPEAGKVRGLDTTDAAVSERVTRILSRVSDDIAGFLKTAAPRLTDNWTVGTCSFRPIEERGRELSGFFINVNPGADRVWASKGNFNDLFRSHGDRAQLSYRGAGDKYLRKGLLDHAWTGLVKAVAGMGMPTVRVLDSSPFDPGCSIPRPSIARCAASTIT
jgi:hypothetical protein